MLSSSKMIWAIFSFASSRFHDNINMKEAVNVCLAVSTSPVRARVRRMECFEGCGKRGAYLLDVCRDLSLLGRVHFLVVV